MCMITYNPFVRTAKEDIKCYKIVKIFSRVKSAPLTNFCTESRTMYNNGIKCGQLSVISSGTSVAYRDDSYENMNKNDNVDYDVVYRSPYYTFIFPEFGQSADYRGIGATQLGWNPFKREVNSGYHSFVNKEDALDCMRLMALESKMYYEEVLGITDEDIMKYFDVIECIIPRGRVYMKGVFNTTDCKNYVSTSFTPIRSLGLSGEINY